MARMKHLPHNTISPAGDGRTGPLGTNLLLSLCAPKTHDRSLTLLQLKSLYSLTLPPVDCFILIWEAFCHTVISNDRTVVDSRGLVTTADRTITSFEQQQRQYLGDVNLLTTEL